MSGLLDGLLEDFNRPGFNGCGVLCPRLWGRFRDFRANFGEAVREFRLQDRLGLLLRNRLFLG